MELTNSQQFPPEGAGNKPTAVRFMNILLSVIGACHLPACLSGRLLTNIVSSYNDQ